MWNKGALRGLLADRLHDRRLIVVSHEAPHEGSRLANSLRPVLRAVKGTWVAYGDEDAAARPAGRGYRLRLVPLDPELKNESYDGLANQGLWPLCHMVFRRPTFERPLWESYRRANERFAEAVLEEAAGQPAVVLIQNYPLALLSRLLKMRNPNLLVCQFWHIPWPNPETFGIFPWKRELLEGLLANDLLGFHLRYDCCNFLDSVDRTVEARIDRERGEVKHAGRGTLVMPFSMGVDAQHLTSAAASPSVDREIDGWKRELGLQTEFVGLAIDRLDCTSGIPECLRALDGFFGRHPEFRGRLTFVQIGTPAREHPVMDRLLSEQVAAQAEQINATWGNRLWQPIVFLRGDFPESRLIALHRLANFCLVGSLHDGMNPVAKEFVASRIDGDGVLILSRYSGAASEFSDAILVNPFAEEEIEFAIHHALRLPAAERRRRMRRMRETVTTNNVYRWAAKIISTALRFEPAEAACQAVGESSVPQFACSSAGAESPFGSEYPMRV